MEQLVFVLILGAIGLIKWLMEKSAEKRSERDTEERIDRLGRPEPVAPPIHAPRPIARPLPDIDAAARKLREALGLPAESDLPRPVERKLPRPLPVPPPVIAYESPAPRVLVDLERRFVAETAPRKSEIPPPVQVKERPEKIPAHITLDELLRSHEGLRKAILVQEILGTPKGLVF